VHSVAVLFGVNSSASTGTIAPELLVPARHSNTGLQRAKSVTLTMKCGSHVSALVPPVRATRNVPPWRGVPALAELVDAEPVVAEVPPHAANTPEPPRTADAAAACWSKSRRVRSPISTPQSGEGARAPLTGQNWHLTVKQPRLHTFEMADNFLRGHHVRVLHVHVKQ